MNRQSVTMRYWTLLLMINRKKDKLSPSFHYHFIAKPIIKEAALWNLLSKNWLDLFARKSTKTYTSLPSFFTLVIFGI